ncbi:MAG: Gfo/Idh/MocA family oxidoreductase [Nanoarchaeota archaeon]
MAMKLLFVGLGSVGQRHLQNVMQIMPEAELYAFRKSGSSQVIKDCKVLDKPFGEYYKSLVVVRDLDAALRIKPDAVIITNFSSAHVETAIAFAKAGCHLFIEKPLGLSLAGIPELERIAKEKKLAVMVGYQLRFSPLYQKVRKIVKDNADKLVSASFEWGTFVPLHHPYEDYSKNHAAREETGGGVVMQLIHEVDVLYDLFGMPRRTFGVGGKLSALDWTGQDTIMAILDFGKAKPLPVHLYLSMAQTKETRRWRFQFTDKTLFVDLGQNSFELFDDKGKPIELVKDETIRNQFFIDEMRLFLGCVAGKRRPLVTLADGRASLEMALGIKKAVQKGGWI